MTDEELIGRLRDKNCCESPSCNCDAAADRIEELLCKNDNLFDLAQQEHSRAERLAALLDRAVNGPWLDGDLERARAALTEAQKDRTERLEAALRKVADKVYAKLSAKGLYAEAQSARDTILALTEKPHDRA